MTKNAREFTLQFFYHYQLPRLNEEKNIGKIQEKIEDFKDTIELKLDKNESLFVTDIVYGVIENYDKVEEKLKEYVKKQNFNRINKTDYSILLLSIYELGWYKKSPKKVVITQALDFTRKYGNPETASLINAILDNYSKNELE